MGAVQNFMANFTKIKGSTIAIVYIFEGESAPGFAHYHVWQSDVISGWLNAVQRLNCRPFILDVRTFVEKALAGTLPHIDYVINLNCGSKELSPMGLVPSTCAFLGIPCIPCDTTGIIVGENKRLSNMIAKYVGLSVPEELPFDNPNGFFRPLNYGSSVGVRRGNSTDNKIDGLYQEFLPGFDITTPYVYDPTTKRLESLPTLIYLPNSGDTDWFFGEKEKETKAGYQRQLIHGIEEDLDELYHKLMSAFNVRTFCRIDARIHITNEDVAGLLNRPLERENLYFIEINTMPTVNINNSFGFCFSGINSKDRIYESLYMHSQYDASVDVHSFLLASSMMAFLKAKC